MSKTTPKKQAKKRQQNKLPLSGSAGKKGKAKSATSKTNKSGNHKRRSPRTKTYNLWLGSRRSLELKFKLKTKKKKRLTKKQQLARKKLRQKMLASAMIVIGLVGLFYFSANLTGQRNPPEIYSPPTPEVVESEPVEEEPAGGMTASAPTTLSIPDVDINTSLITLGRNQDGTMEVPESYEVAGWYKHSPTPGEIGPTIITGHVDSYRGPAVFWRLSQTRPDQTVELTREDGQKVKYSVTKVKQFDQSNFPTNEVYGNIEHSGLRLITCGGVFDHSSGNYSHNTVVFAKKL